MDVTLSHYQAFVAQSTEIEAITEALRTVGAVQCQSQSGWYDLPPEPVWASVPRDRTHNIYAWSPKLRALGTAQFRVRLSDTLRGHTIFVIAVQTSLDPTATLDPNAPLDPTVRLYSWRKLVSLPGTAVFEGTTKRPRGEWTKIAESIANDASSNRCGPTDLNLGIICKRRVAILRRTVEEINAGLLNLPEETSFNLAIANSVYLDGSCIEDCDISVLPDLMNIAADAAINRVILHITAERLRNAAAAMDPSGHHSEEWHRQPLKGWLTHLDHDLHFASTALSCIRETEPLAPFNRVLGVSHDFRIITALLDRSSYALGWHLNLRICNKIQESHETIISRTDDILQEMALVRNQIRMSVVEIQESHETIISRTDDILDEMALVRNQIRISVVSTYGVISAILIVVAGSALLDTIGLGLAISGFGVIVLSMYCRRSITNVEPS